MMARDGPSRAKIPLYHTLAKKVNRQFAQKSYSQVPKILFIFTIEKFLIFYYNKNIKINKF
jgi:hypothetical protein